MTQKSIREAFPILARHEGVWEGWYRHIAPDGTLVDQHKSKLVCRVQDDKPTLYHQTNYYTWENGETETRDFKGDMVGDKLIFDNDIIKGWAAQVDVDDSKRTMFLHWERVNEPDLYLYEMIQISDCGHFRTRVWQWIKDGKTLQRTLIDEQRTSHDWRGQ